MNLYRVEARVTVFIAAESDEEARELAAQGVRDEVGENDEATSVMRVARVRHSDSIPKGWPNSLPWGRSEQEFTCSDIAKGKWK